MRKLKIALLIALILCLVCGVLVACDPIGKDPGAPDTPGGPGDPEVPDSGIRSVSSSQAYAAFKEAALNVYAGNYFNFSTTIGLDYIKDKYGRYFAVKIRAAIDPEEDANSEMLVELWRMNEAGGEETLLLGLYYFDGTIVYDCTGIKKGAQVVKTEDLDITAIAKAVDKALGGTSVGQLLLDNLLGIELGDLGSVERILTALFAPTSRAVVAADGTVWFVTADGRAPGRAAGMTIPQLAHLIRVLGGRDALNLDGGGSTTLWMDGEVVNHPSDNRRLDHEGERRVPDIICFRP